MTSRLVWSLEAWADYEYWQGQDKKTLMNQPADQGLLSESIRRHRQARTLEGESGGVVVKASR